jgi:hypothetical protein
MVDDTGIEPASTEYGPPGRRNFNLALLDFHNL